MSEIQRYDLHTSTFGDGSAWMESALEGDFVRYEDGVEHERQALAEKNKRMRELEEKCDILKQRTDVLRAIRDLRQAKLAKYREIGKVYEFYKDGSMGGLNAVLVSIQAALDFDKGEKQEAPDGKRD
jgi:hypothetical protein